MTKSKSSLSSIVVPLVFILHLVDDAQSLNDACDAGAARQYYHLLLKCKDHCNHKD